MIISKGSLNGKITDKQSLKGKINTTIQYEEVYPELQEKTTTPTKQTQIIVPDENIYGLSKVTVNSIPNNYIEPQGQKEITNNGTYDVTSFASANVDIEIGKLTNEEYAEANDDLDDILEGNTPTTIYPPDWSEIGYEDTPQNIIEGFNYAKEIKNNWNSSVTSLNMAYRQDYNLIYFPLVDTSNVTDMTSAFNLAENLEFVPLLNTSKVKTMRQTFQACKKLKSVPVFDTSAFDNTLCLLATFQNCPLLTNESLNNIMQMCINASNVVTNISYKNLNQVGLTSAQVTICQGLSNYQAFLNAGWTTGY